MSTEEYYPSTSWSDNMTVKGICLNSAHNLSKHCLQKPIFFNGLSWKFNPSLKSAGPPKRFKCEAITQADWE